MSAGVGLTDPGLTRPTNEDAFLVEPPLYTVADGMGGHRAGEIASRVAVNELIENVVVNPSSVAGRPLPDDIKIVWRP